MSQSTTSVREEGCTRITQLRFAAVGIAVLALATVSYAQSLGDLAKPMQGRSMRSSSAAVDKNGDFIHGNLDNSRVEPGQTKVVLDANGPGEVTHMWFTFLGPGRHLWTPNGSANHQEILLRVYYDGRERPDIMEKENAACRPI